MATTEDRSEREVYELGYLILSSIAEEDLPKTVTKIKDIVKKAGGELASEDPMKIDLAYEMSKVVGARKYIVNDAYIGWSKFELAPGSVSEVDGGVKKLEEVLRFLIIKAPRDTIFTFAEAKKKEAERLQALEDAKIAIEAPSEPAKGEGVQ